MLLTHYVTSFVDAQGATVPPGTLTEKIFLLLAGALAGALLGFLANYALDRIKMRREPTKRLSWDASVRRTLIDVSEDIKSKVQFLYEGVPVTALTHVRCTVTNTGNQVVKDHVLRFPFPVGVTLLKPYLDPVPEQELAVTRIEDGPEGHCRYRIGHLERNEQVVFNFVTAGGEFGEWQPHSRNPEGGVEFQRRDVTGLKQDQDHLLPFFLILLLLLTLPVAIAEIGFGNVSGLAASALRIGLLLAMLPHVRPLVRIVEQLLARAKEPAALSGTNVLHGNHIHGSLVVARNLEGDVHFDPEREESTSATGNGEVIAEDKSTGAR